MTYTELEDNSHNTVARDMPGPVAGLPGSCTGGIACDLQVSIFIRTAWQFLGGRSVAQFLNGHHTSAGIVSRHANVMIGCQRGVQISIVEHSQRKVIYRNTQRKIEYIAM